MINSTNNKQSSKNYIDMYRKLPRNSVTRRRIERMLDDETQNDIYPVPNCVPNNVRFFSDNMLIHNDLHPFGNFNIASNMDDYFINFSKQMNKHFDLIKDNMELNDNSNNYSFSKSSSTQTVIGKDNKKYTSTDVKTSKIKNGSKKSYKKKIYNTGNKDVQIITHADGRRQIIGDKSILDTFPKHMLKNNSRYKIIKN
jgi:hypothetical protein